MGRRRRKNPDPNQMGDLTFWETTNEDGEDLLLWAEMSTDPKAAEGVEGVKRVMRDLGWTQTVGD